MRIPKIYGEYKIESCPFCEKQGIVANKQGVPVCIAHKDKLLENMKCVCGKTLDILKGKYGIFFNCFSCGNIGLRKVLEINKPL